MPLRKDLKESKDPKNKGGRPTKYRAVFNDQARKLCLLGATDQELANFFEVDVATVNRWKIEHKGFCESLKRGKMEADAIVADKLFKRATGYTHADVDIKVIRGKIRITKLQKHYPPDTTAAIFWLKNRQKENWRDRQHIDIDLNKLTDEQLDKVIQAHLTEAKKNQK